MRGYAIAERALSSFDRQFAAHCRVQRPDRYRLLDGLPRDEPRIALGGGVSYVGAGFGNGATSQQWQVSPDSSGSYQFVNRNSGLCLAVPTSGSLRQQACGSAGSLAFTITTVG